MKKFDKTKNPRIVYLWILILIILAAGTCGVAAKYIQASEQKIISQAKEFYFTSDLLTEEGANYTLNPGTTQVRFTLMNHIDELRYSDDLILYNVYVNDVVLVENGRLNQNDDEIVFAVENGKTYHVRAEGIAGYRKTISATFTVMTEPDGFYKSLDASNEYFVLLTVWTEAVSGNVTIDFPAGLIPDATDEKLTNVVNYEDSYYEAGRTNPVELQTYSSLVYRFFKDDLSTAYTVDDFNVMMGELEAIPGTP